MVFVNSSLHTLAILAMLVCYGVGTLDCTQKKCNTDFSLGPVQEFVGISFTRDNLNCFRVN